jgi:hypothetical protein
VRGNVHGHVDLAILERGHPDGVVGNGAKHDRLDPGRSAPVLVVRVELDAVVFDPADEPVRA